MSGLAILLLLLIMRPLLFASLDPDVAAAQGVPVRLLGLGFMALLLLPAAIAHQVSSRPSTALALAAGLAVAMIWLGIAIGFYTGYPGSVCISLLAFVSYVAVVGSSHVRRKHG